MNIELPGFPWHTAPAVIPGKPHVRRYAAPLHFHFENQRIHR